MQTSSKAHPNKSKAERKEAVEQLTNHIETLESRIDVLQKEVVTHRLVTPDLLKENIIEEKKICIRRYSEKPITQEDSYVKIDVDLLKGKVLERLAQIEQNANAQMTLDMSLKAFHTDLEHVEREQRGITQEIDECSRL